MTAGCLPFHVLVEFEDRECETANFDRIKSKAMTTTSICVNAAVYPRQ